MNGQNDALSHFHDSKNEFNFAELIHIQIVIIS